LLHNRIKENFKEHKDYVLELKNARIFVSSVSFFGRQFNRFYRIYRRSHGEWQLPGEFFTGPGEQYADGRDCNRNCQRLFAGPDE
jgi:hypothetical protein